MLNFFSDFYEEMPAHRCTDWGNQYHDIALYHLLLRPNQLCLIKIIYKVYISFPLCIVIFLHYNIFNQSHKEMYLQYQKYSLGRVLRPPSSGGSLFSAQLRQWRNCKRTKVSSKAIAFKQSNCFDKNLLFNMFMKPKLETVKYNVRTVENKLVLWKTKSNEKILFTRNAACWTKKEILNRSNRKELQEGILNSMWVKLNVFGVILYFEVLY